MKKYKKILDEDRQEKYLEYLGYLDSTEFDQEAEIWLLQQEMEEILTNASFEDDVKIEIETERRCKRMIIEVESEDEDDWELVEEQHPVFGKESFTAEEICELIRVRAAQKGVNSLTVSDITEMFGQKRHYIKRRKVDISESIKNLTL